DRLKASRVRALELHAYIAHSLCEWNFKIEPRPTLHLIYLFFKEGIMPPAWVREDFLEAVERKPDSWDKAFGKPPKTNKARRRERRAYEEGQRLIREKNCKIAINDLFVELGRVLGVKPGTASDHYYAHREAKKEAAIREWLGPSATDDLVRGYLDNE